MSETSDTDGNGSVIFVAEQHHVKVDVHPVPNPPNIVPETQQISTSPSNNHEEDVIDVDTIPETQTFSNATGKYQVFLLTMYKNILAPQKVTGTCLCTTHRHL